MSDQPNTSSYGEEPTSVLDSGLDTEDTDSGLSPDDWQALLTAIRMGRCTPFLGAGASVPHVRGASSIARDWATEKNFPFPNGTELIKVAQYLSVRFSPLTAKELMITECNVAKPSFTPGGIYDVLADLDIPVFLTTNYDSLMTYALESKGKRPMQELCKWQQRLSPESPLAKGFRPTKDAPLVFHFHGHWSDPDSLVLDEDDYLEFLKYVAKNPDTIPPQVQRSLTTSSVLFLGYSLSDWTIQVIFRSITEYLSLSHANQQPHLSVQLVPALGDQPTPEQRKQARVYLEKYFGRQHVSVYWGSCDRFAAELKSRLGSAAGPSKQ